MEIGTFFLVALPAMALIAGGLAVAVKRMLPNVGDWLPVLSVTYLPPILIQLVLLPFMLRNYVPDQGPDAADGPSVFAGHIALYSGSALLWLFVASPAAFAALGWSRRRA